MKLIKLLEEKIEQLDSLEFPLEEEQIYFENLDSQIATNKDLSTITDANILMALITMYNDKLNFIEDIFPFFLDEVIPKFEDLDTSDIVDFLVSIITLEDEEILDTILELDSDLSINKIVKVILQNNTNKSKIDVTKALCEFKKASIDTLLDYEVARKFASLMKGNAKNIGVDFTQFAMYRDNYEMVQIIKDKYFKQARDIFGLIDSKIAEFEEIFNHENVLSTIRRISERNFDLSKQKKNFEKSITQKRILYSKTIDYLNKINDDKSIEVPNEIFKKLDDELLIDFIKVILNNDRSVYTNLQIENIRKDKYEIVEKMFLQKQIDINKLEPELKEILIKNVKMEELDKILYYINLPELKWIKSHPNFVQVVVNTNEEVLKRVSTWIQLEYISKEIAYKNIGILLANNNIFVNDKDVIALFDKVKNNVELLSKITDITNKIIKNSSIIFMETSKLKQAIELIKKYKLDLKSENSKGYSLDIINHIDNFDDLDSFIELGFASYIQNNPQLLRSDSKDIISRLSIMVNTGLNPYSIEDRLLGSITNGKNFFIPNDNLKDFNLLKVEEQLNGNNYDILKNNPRIIISKSVLELDIVKYLDNNYKQSDLEYNFDGIIISRIKFLRNLECLIKNNATDNFIFCALTFGSVLDIEAIEFINNIILEFNGRVKKR